MKSMETEAKTSANALPQAKPELTDDVLRQINGGVFHQAGTKKV